MQMEIMPPQGVLASPGFSLGSKDNRGEKGITGAKARWQSFYWMENQGSVHRHLWLNHKMEASVKAVDREKSLESKTRTLRYPIPMINKNLTKHFYTQAC
jgi:hypothetical protein